MTGQSILISDISRYLAQTTPQSAYADSSPYTGEPLALSRSSRQSSHSRSPAFPAGDQAESRPPRSTPSPRPRCGIPRHLRSRDGLWPHKCFAPWAKPWRRRNSLPPSIKNHGSPRNTAHRVAVSRNTRSHRSTHSRSPAPLSNGWAESRPPRSTPSPRPRCGIPWAHPG